MHEVTREFRETCARWRLWGAGEKVLAAVSGGIDSMVLLRLLLEIPPSIRPQVAVAHFDHRLRGKESAEDARWVMETSTDLGLPCEVGRAPPWRSRENLQDRARRLRYRFFCQMARKRGIRRLITAHQATDQVETFLIRWLQGSGLRGLAGIPLKGQIVGDDGTTVEIVRPLLFIGREAISDYARRHRVAYREDPSNRQPKYLRNRVRRLVNWVQGVNPNIERLGSRNAVLLRADEEYLESETRRCLAELRSGDRYSLTLYRQLPAALRYRLLHQIASLPGESVLKLDHLLLHPDPQKSYSIPRGLVFQKDYLHFRFSPRKRLYKGRSAMLASHNPCSRPSKS